MAKKFPTPHACKLKDRAVLCTAERILDLFNQKHWEERQRITKNVKKWFAEQAPQHGWAGCHFLPEVTSGHGAGCVLFVPPQTVNVTIIVKATTLVLEAETGEEE